MPFETFDHDDVARPDRVAEHRRSSVRALAAVLRRACRSAGPPRARASADRRARPRSMSAAVIELGEAGVQRRRLGAELQHVAEHGDAPALAPTTGVASSSADRRLHRGRVGIVALVDQR